MFDTHTHLNFKSFKKNLKEVIADSKDAGITNMIVVGTDIDSSKRAIEIASKYEGIYAAVGIHPHHVYQYQKSNIQKQNGFLKLRIKEVEQLLNTETSKIKEPIRQAQDGKTKAPPTSEVEEERSDGKTSEVKHKDKILAIGEIGLDKHIYTNTKYENYHLDKEFLEMQKFLFIEQFKLSKKFNKAVILHNREAIHDILHILAENWDDYYNGRVVFHCCEPDNLLLDFAIKHHAYIGVDGDVTYRKDKQEFVKKIPLELLVLETDSPYLLPEPLKSQRKYPNTPANLFIVVQYIADLRGISKQEIIKVTTKNAQNLFGLYKKNDKLYPQYTPGV